MPPSTNPNHSGTQVRIRCQSGLFLEYTCGPKMTLWAKFSGLYETANDLKSPWSFMAAEIEPIQTFFFNELGV